VSLVFLQEQLKHFGVFYENSHDDDGEEEDVKEWLDATEEAPRPPSLPVRAGLRPRYRCSCRSFAAEDLCCVLYNIEERYFRDGY